MRESVLCILLQGQMHPSFKVKTKAQTEKLHGKLTASQENEESCVQGGCTAVHPGSTTVCPSPRPTVVASSHCGSVAS